jgi:hypothetical protein
VRLMLLRRVERIRRCRSLEEAADELNALAQSKTWKGNQRLGGANACWCLVAFASAYCFGRGSPPCDTVCGMCRTHVVTFFLRCLLTMLWFVYAFAQELPGERKPDRDASQELVRDLPVVTYGSEAAGLRWNLTSCTMCLNDFAAGEQLRALSCGHYFHLECLAEWLSHRRTCPLCQRWDSRPASEQHRDQHVAVAARERDAAANYGEEDRPAAPAAIRLTTGGGQGGLRHRQRP